MNKRFPCPYCKGKASWVEPVLNVGTTQTVECGFCEGKGMIEVGSEKHKEIQRNNPPNEFFWEALGERNYALLQVIDALEKLPSDGWSEGPYLLEICRKAVNFVYEPPAQRNEHQW